jgi:diaminohydroxyphosphoribosylaminopyrimidine deaminase/5-amino-6-(5-phosphoribosylamino)uracil reductase
MDPGEDLAWMRAALALAQRGLGNVWPNPAVGCVIVRDGVAVGRGWTQPGGRPHAETEALARAGAAARGATVYVSLEPCCHWGRTPPCTDALIAAGIARAVIATRDPDPRVNGEGVARLRAAGIAVTEGVAEAEAAELNAGFIARIRSGRPLVTLKLAATLDGRIATASGESRWITGEAARRAAHLLRASHDAVLVGAGTAATDDPALTVRLPGVVPAARPGPVRVVADGRLRLPLTSVLVATARQTPTWILTLPGNDRARIGAFADAGCTVMEVRADATGQPDLAEGLRALGSRGITRVLAEGGGTLAAALLGAGLVDRLAWFAAPGLIGSDGAPAVGALALAGLDAMPRFRRTGITPVGEDLLLTFTRAE